MAVKSFLLLTAILLWPMSMALSQPAFHKESVQPPLASWILGSTQDSVTVCFAYSIPFPRIVFTKTNGTTETFGANLAFSVDAADSASGTNYHRFHPREISVNRFSRTQDPKLRYEDFVLMTLPKSTYRVTAEVRDDNQQITYLHRTLTKQLAHPSRSGILSTFFLDSLSGNRLFPELTNNIAPFPRPISIALLVQANAASPLTLTLTTRTGSIVSRSDSLIPLKARLVPGDSEIALSFTRTPDSTSSLYITHFDIDTLREGSYEIQASFDSTTEKLDFSYVWTDKPLMLKDFAMALSLLKYIVPDSVYSLINSGDEEERRERFDMYWKSHDPTPNTAYNELEAEFYQRADYAFEHFRTVATNNGTTTDRGKAYILFGQPASIKREFRTDGTYEIWYYPNLNSVLVFKEQRFGEFKLYQTEKL